MLVKPVKHHIDLLDRQSSEWNRDEVTYFYVDDVFCKHFADFQENLEKKF